MLLLSFLVFPIITTFGFIKLFIEPFYGGETIGPDVYIFALVFLFLFVIIYNYIS